MIRVLAVGKKHQPWIEPGIKRYQTRLHKPWDLNWQLVPHSNFQADKARDEESTRLLKHLKPDDYVILLDEIGSQLTSPAYANKLQSTMANGRNIVFVIGGAYGVNTQMHQRADLILSLSSMVYPHQMVRLILTEQLYRAQEIAKNSSYHHI